jgi:peptidyl-prolyl cis-trans isomerase B (cyclophilin B)
MPKSATFTTSKGEIVVELFDKDTPATVANFEKLAAKGFYDNLNFHRVIPDFMIQGGCPQGTGTGGPGYQTDCEIKPGIKHEKGSLAMAHAGSCKHDKKTGAKTSGKCSNGSQFYITHRATEWLDGVHTVFGRVTKGQDVVDAIKQGDKLVKIVVA